jgi:hypothetical protein
VRPGDVSLGQLKLVSAIERCRTAALGGHVERCEACAHLRICYNSCRNRHCPKCQAAAAKGWLADRRAELLPVPYFHVVFTLPGPLADTSVGANSLAISSLEAFRTLASVHLLTPVSCRRPKTLNNTIPDARRGDVLRIGSTP